jgi:hypothetical protein
MKRVGIKPNILSNCYNVLGDDIVIYDPLIKDSYNSIMSELGVQINQSKTHESSFFMEFAKTYWYNHTLITPFKIGSIVET